MAGGSGRALLPDPLGRPARRHRLEQRRADHDLRRPGGIRDLLPELRRPAKRVAGFSPRLRAADLRHRRRLAECEGLSLRDAKRSARRRIRRNLRAIFQSTGSSHELVGARTQGAQARHLRVHRRGKFPKRREGLLRRAQQLQAQSAIFAPGTIARHAWRSTKSAECASLARRGDSAARCFNLMQRSPLTGLRQRAMPRCRPAGAARRRRFALGAQFRLRSRRARTRETRMFPSASLLALAATLLLTVADNVPALDVESSCRAAAKMGDRLSLDATLRQCLADEKSARDELEKQWTQFAVALRERYMTTTETGGDPSYVEVLVCLQMGRDAAQMGDPLGGGRQDKK